MRSGKWVSERIRSRKGRERGARLGAMMAPMTVPPLQGVDPVLSRRRGC